MTLQEAIRSGKKFKRPHQKRFNTANTNGIVYELLITFEDALATDWEVEELKKELTPTEVKTALFKAFINKSGYSVCSINPNIKDQVKNNDLLAIRRDNIDEILNTEDFINILFGE